jgi:hypothetical protein
MSNWGDLSVESSANSDVIVTLSVTPIERVEKHLFIQQRSNQELPNKRPSNSFLRCQMILP